MSVVANIQPETEDNDLGRKFVSRIVQFKGKRHNIRLEAIYWDILERMAAERECKLNILINEFITDPDSGNNKTSFMRLRAVNWLNDNLNASNEKLFLRNTEVWAVLQATELPAFVFSETTSVSRYNSAFQTWLWNNIKEFRKDVDISRIRISFRRSFTVLNEGISHRNGILKKEKGAILLPGFVFPVTMNLVALNNYSDEGRVFMGIFNPLAQDVT